MGTMSVGWVLIVEDDARLARAVGQVLKVEGVESVEHAETASEALTLASRPELVAALVDVWIPGANGVDLAVTLRGLHPDADILVWSGTEDIPVVRRAHAARFDFLTKEAGAELLRARAQRWAQAQEARGTPPPSNAEQRAAEIRQRCNLTAQQSRALVLALEQRSYNEIATALGTTKKAVEALSVRVHRRTQRTLAEWTQLAREELHERAEEGRATGVRRHVDERDLTKKRRM